MKTLVLYDSLYGNTEKIAQAIAGALGAKAETVVDRASGDLAGLELLIVGCPTHGGRPSEPMSDFIGKIADGDLGGVKIATFDTRFARDEHGKPLQMLMRMIGFAGPKLAEALSKKGGELVGEPEGFIVEDKEGPLKTGELERAAAWAKNLNSA